MWNVPICTFRTLAITLVIANRNSFWLSSAKFVILATCRTIQISKYLIFCRHVQLMHVIYVS